MIFCMSVAEPDPGADAALEDCIVRIAGGGLTENEGKPPEPGGFSL